MFDQIKTLAAIVPLNTVFSFTTFDTIDGLVNALLTPIFSIASLLILFYFLWAGWKYLTSRGSKEELAKARTMIIQSIIGGVLLSILFLVIRLFFANFLGVGDLAPTGSSTQTAPNSQVTAPTQAQPATQTQDQPALDVHLPEERGLR